MRAEEGTKNRAEFKAQEEIDKVSFSPSFPFPLLRLSAPSPIQRGRRRWHRWHCSRRALLVRCQQLEGSWSGLTVVIPLRRPGTGAPVRLTAGMAGRRAEGMANWRLDFGSGNPDLFYLEAEP